MLLSFAAGCGSELGAEVSGTVLLDGTGVGPGMVTFVGSEGGGNPASGAIGMDGSYTLHTANTPGLKPGKYTASVSVLHSEPVAPGERSTVPPKLITPEKYKDPATSGLSFEVKPGSQTIDIPLTSK